MKEDENEVLSSNHQQNGLLLDKLIKTSQVKTEKLNLPFLKPIKGIKFPGNQIKFSIRSSLKSGNGNRKKKQNSFVFSDFMGNQSLIKHEK